MVRRIQDASPERRAASGDTNLELELLIAALRSSRASAHCIRELRRAVEIHGADAIARRVSGGSAPDRMATDTTAPPLLRLDDLVDPRLLLAHVDTGKWRDVVISVTTRLSVLQPHLDISIIEAELLDPPRSRGWLLGSGVALPHLLVPGLHGYVMAVATTRRPLRITGPDGLPVRVAFFLLEPEHQPEQHLLLLSRIAGICAHASNLGFLLAAESADALCDAIAVLDDDMDRSRRP